MSFISDTWGYMKETWTRWLVAIKRWLSKYGPKVLGPIAAVVVVVIGFLLLTMGFKELQVGGLLGKLLGKKGEPIKAVDVANTVDKDRVGKDGKVIHPGNPDSVGQTQAIVVPIKEPGLLSDPKTVEFVAPGETKPTKVSLPDGVTNRDVSSVVVIKPEVVAVTVKDTSKKPVTVKHIDEILKKYRR
jgi:phage tail sheath protein FI